MAAWSIPLKMNSLSSSDKSKISKLFHISLKDQRKIFPANIKGFHIDKIHQSTGDNFLHVEEKGFPISIHCT